MKSSGAFLSLVVSLATLACSGGSSLPSGAVRELLEAHNVVRASAQPEPSPGLTPLTWSESAAAVAQAWANGCRFEHNAGRGSYGENLSANFPPDAQTPTEVVRSWAAEASDYDFFSNRCNGVCGHYTQLVWRSTFSVGCAKATCPASTSPFGIDGSWDFWVCNYDPPGNVSGQRPY